MLDLEEHGASALDLDTVEEISGERALRRGTVKKTVGYYKCVLGMVKHSAGALDLDRHSRRVARFCVVAPRRKTILLR